MEPLKIVYDACERWEFLPGSPQMKFCSPIEDTSGSIGSDNYTVARKEQLVKEVDALSQKICARKQAKRFPAMLEMFEIQRYDA